VKVACPVRRGGVGKHSLAVRPAPTRTRSGTMDTITGGTRPANGPNLFHSFDRFSVGTNDTARFSGPTGIANILSRVTGQHG
jgi:large exoprotein involved in heme utilization and adhesion